ncbi:MAG: hypothetical protein IKS49_01090, partial [Actinomycetaceae bacterium]|nr:hypothetical protein [Actinomycetaceae bacterium]
HGVLLARLQSHLNYSISAAAPQGGMLILLKIIISLCAEPYRRSGKLGRSARPALERILASPDSPEILRRGASRALALLK